MTDSLTARAILFDMDGTLVDSTAVVEHVWGRFADEYGVSVETILADSHGIKAIETIRKYGPDGIDVEAASAKIESYEISMLDGIVEVPGAANFVAQLRDEHYAIVTSAPRKLALVRFEHCGITVPPVLVAAEDVAEGKPNPEPYLSAARQLGIDPADCIVFEDAPAGIRAGRAAGMRVVVVGDVAGEDTEGLPRIANYRDARIEHRADGEFVVHLSSAATKAAPSGTKVV